MYALRAHYSHAMSQLLNQHKHTRNQVMCMCEPCWSAGVDGCNGNLVRVSKVLNERAFAFDWTVYSVVQEKSNENGYNMN